MRKQSKTTTVLPSIPVDVTVLEQLTVVQPVVQQPVQQELQAVQTVPVHQEDVHMSGFCMNEARVAGYLGKNPELKTLPGGTSVCRFSLASTKHWKDKVTGKPESKTTWHDITIWGNAGERFARDIRKGDCVMIGGEIEHGDYTDKEGIKRYTTTIRATQVDYIKWTYRPSAVTPKVVQSQPTPVNNNGLDDDLPF